MSQTASRAVVIFGVVLLVALIGGAWIGAAKGTIPDTGEPGGPVSSPYCYPVEGSPYFSIPNPAGVLPCAICEVDSHGPKSIRLSETACTGTNLTVYCMTEDGVWTQTEVFDPGVTSDSLAAIWTVGQHGTCGIFPTGSVPASGVISSDQ